MREGVSVIVTGLTDSLKDDEVRRHFLKFGLVEDFHRISTERAYVFSYIFCAHKLVVFYTFPGTIKVYIPKYIHGTKTVNGNMVTKNTSYNFTIYKNNYFTCLYTFF